MNTLVVFYSSMGSTTKMAAAVIKATGATGRELVDTKKRTGIVGSGFAAMLGRTTRLRDPDYSVEGFDTVVLMTPIWAGNPTPAMNTFLKNVNLTGKGVILGLVGAGDENPGAAEKMRKKVEVNGGKFVDVACLKGLSPKEGVESLTDEQVARESEKLVSKLR
jgi:flavodoxin